MASNAELQAQHLELQGLHASLQEDHATLRTERGSLQDAYADLQGAHDAAAVEARTVAAALHGLQEAQLLLGNVPEASSARAMAEAAAVSPSSQPGRYEGRYEGKLGSSVKALAPHLGLAEEAEVGDAAEGEPSAPLGVLQHRQRQLAELLQRSLGDAVSGQVMQGEEQGRCLLGEKWVILLNYEMHRPRCMKLSNVCFCVSHGWIIA